MPAHSQEERKEEKRKKILDGARKVFIKKGFIDATMKDIIDEVGISRGGIYLYFQSLDEIFVEVVRNRNGHRFDAIRTQIEHNAPFDEVLSAYFAEHKDRLLYSSNDSILRATYEFYFTHKTTPSVKAFQRQQFNDTKQTILSIFALGVRQGVLRNEHLDQLAETFIFVIEGLNAASLTEGTEEQQVDDQFTFLKQSLPYQKD
ncbi:TetR family transcriptional regulator [Lactobacillus selangorensis]|uniref:TetR family transcriptional regulator n=1 Tax=Lactobacillus selangorensis TaxID=81857 RepID=A0A0R2FWU6_9LACO|nr:TetR/AcrR family transcriptional regulator [Lactobacillus selangorensis]KRN28755.1 TetR family transcriptional regulator [Lactobacillus selangorensis]KRN32835.1 TetR family transcriptional regulator [Lactobacillus selangorensis]